MNKKTVALSTEEASTHYLSQCHLSCEETTFPSVHYLIFFNLSVTSVLPNMRFCCAVPSGKGSESAKNYFSNNIFFLTIQRTRAANIFAVPDLSTNSQVLKIAFYDLLTTMFPKLCSAVSCFFSFHHFNSPGPPCSRHKTHFSLFFFLKGEKKKKAACPFFLN